MTHLQNIQEILKGCDDEGTNINSEWCCEACERGLSEYVKAVKVELERKELREDEQNLIQNSTMLLGLFNSKKLTPSDLREHRFKIKEFVEKGKQDCEEAIKLGEKG